MAVGFAVFAMVIVYASAQDTRDPAYDNVCEVLLTRLSYGEQHNTLQDLTTTQLKEKVKQEDERLKQDIDRLEQQIEENTRKVYDTKW